MNKSLLLLHHHTHSALSAGLGPKLGLEKNLIFLSGVKFLVSDSPPVFFWRNDYRFLIISIHPSKDEENKQA